MQLCLHRRIILPVLCSPNYFCTAYFRVTSLQRAVRFTRRGHEFCLLMTTMVIIFMNPPLILQSEQRAVHPSSVPKQTRACPAQHILWAMSADVAVYQGTHLHTSKGQWWEGLSPQNLDKLSVRAMSPSCPKVLSGWSTGPFWRKTSPWHNRHQKLRGSWQGAG